MLPDQRFRDKNKKVGIKNQSQEPNVKQSDQGLGDQTSQISGRGISYSFFVSMVFLLALMLLITVIYSVFFKHGQRNENSANRRFIREVVELYPRGTIYDRNQVALAKSIIAEDLYLNLDYFLDVDNRDQFRMACRWHAVNSLKLDDPNLIMLSHVSQITPKELIAEFKKKLANLDNKRSNIIKAYQQTIKNNKAVIDDYKQVNEQYKLLISDYNKIIAQQQSKIQAYQDLIKDPQMVALIANYQANPNDLDIKAAYQEIEPIIIAYQPLDEVIKQYQTVVEPKINAYNAIASTIRNYNLISTELSSNTCPTNQQRKLLNLVKNGKNLSAEYNGILLGRQIEHKQREYLNRYQINVELFNKEQRLKFIEEKEQQQLAKNPKYKPLNPNKLTLAEQKRYINQYNLKGIELKYDPGYRRVYPFGSVIAPLIGKVNYSEKRDFDGVEQTFDSQLEPTAAPPQINYDQSNQLQLVEQTTPTLIKTTSKNNPKGHTIRIERSSKGKVLSIQEKNKGTPGETVELTIDINAQQMLFDYIAHAVDYNKALAASGIIVDSKSGEVIAMANYPSYNPNWNSKNSSSPNSKNNKEPNYVRNTVLTDLREVGSTLKPFTTIEGLQRGIIKPDSIIEIGSKTYNIDPKSRDGIITDLGFNESLTPVEILIKSSNIGISKIAQQLPSREMVRIYQKLGFFRPSGINLIGELKVTMANDYKRLMNGNWRLGLQARVSYGYVVRNNIPQLAKAYGAIANLGVVKDLSLVRNISYLQSQEEIQAEQQRENKISERVFSASATKLVTQMLEEVNFSNYRTNLPGYTAAIKTGTVEKIDPDTGKYYRSRTKNITYTAGFAPARDPRFIIVVMVDEPTYLPKVNGKEQHLQGGTVAAPLFKDILASLSQIYNIPEDNSSVKRASFNLAYDLQLEALSQVMQEVKQQTPHLNNY